jgi:ubiquinone/menaquinone biosynthesis C-methylase UbiE
MKSVFSLLPRSLAGHLVYGAGVGRTLLYFAESLPVLATNRFFANPELPPPTNQQLEVLRKAVETLLRKESELVASGDLPLSVFEFETPWRHAKNYTGVLLDGLRVAWRMRQKNHKDFSAQSSQLAKDLPEYYQRNFHFQTDGYLSESSARRYDHQVEILFNGMAMAMRRQIIPILRAKGKADGRGLDIGCGSGASTWLLAHSQPDVQWTGLDLSRPYLKVAADRLRERLNVDWLQGDATQLSFKDESFDQCVSIFLFHELPHEERLRTLAEAWRVLRPGGLLLVADSLQWDDSPELNWALERFPKVYHEPFYKNYLHHAIEKDMKEVTGLTPQSQFGFFTKVVWLNKPETPHAEPLPSADAPEPTKRRRRPA